MKKLLLTLFAALALSAGMAHAQESATNEQKMNAALWAVAQKQGMPAYNRNTESVEEYMRDVLAWYEDSAKKGDKGSIHLLGPIFDQALLLVKQDYSQAAFWFEKDGGDAYAQRKLGLYRYLGLDGVKDIPAAVAWFRKGAAGGDEVAQAMLASIFESGDPATGVKQDYQQAVFWYEKAAAQGWDEAQLNLGVMYAYGHGVKKDLAVAIGWEQKAAAQGNEKAKRNVIKYKQMMNQPAGNVLD